MSKIKRSTLSMKDRLRLCGEIRRRLERLKKAEKEGLTRYTWLTMGLKFIDIYCQDLNHDVQEKAMMVMDWLTNE